MEPISEDQYQQEVNRIAKEVIEEAEVENRDVSEVADERVDGHRWVIYTYYNFFVLVNSNNYNAITEEYGGEVLDAQGNVDYMAIAYCAMRADVQEAM